MPVVSGPTRPSPAPHGRAGTELPVAVIGAGPHGVSAAVHLRRAGARAHVFGDPMSFWRTMPVGMKLRSNLSATNMVEVEGPLSLARYEAVSGTRIEAPVPLEHFVDYGTWVVQSALPDLDARRVVELDRTPRGFVLRLSDQDEILARRVVVAAGIAPFPRIPARFEDLPAERTSHTSEHRDLTAFAGRRVAVVGGGQSALETAALLHEAGAAQVEVLVRTPAVVWLRGHSVKKILGRAGPIVYAPTDVGPLWYSRLVAVPELFRLLPRQAQDRIARRSIRPACSHFVRVRLGAVALTTGVAPTSVQERHGSLSISLSDGSTREVDHLMFGTGYEVDFGRYPFLAPGLRAGVRMAGGFPVLGRGLETSVPGLHVAGAPAAWSFGPIMRFVSGSWYAGRAIARAIAA
jgi:thioredoxin reductase